MRWPWQKRPPRSSLATDEHGLRWETPNGPAALRWKDLESVRVVTTDQGPFVDDVFLVLQTSTHDWTIPSETPGFDAVLPHLQRLEGFDNHAWIEAMGSTENGEFLCWIRTRD